MSDDTYFEDASPEQQAAVRAMRQCVSDWSRYTAMGGKDTLSNMSLRELSVFLGGSYGIPEKYRMDMARCAMANITRARDDVVKPDRQMWGDSVMSNHQAAGGSEPSSKGGCASAASEQAAGGSGFAPGGGVGGSFNVFASGGGAYNPSTYGAAPITSIDVPEPKVWGKSFVTITQDEQSAENERLRKIIGEMEAEADRFCDIPAAASVFGPGGPAAVMEAVLSTKRYLTADMLPKSPSIGDTVTIGPRRPPIGLHVEAHNPEPVDPAKAMDAVRAMCGGGS